MNSQDVMTIIRDRGPDLRLRFGLKNLSVFGSVARGDAKDESDVDILVEFEGTADFDRFMDLKFQLEDLLGCEVDLATPKALRPRLRPAIEKEAIRVA